MDKIQLTQEQEATKRTMDRKYPNRYRKGVKKALRSHMHWLTSKRFCKICGKRIPYSFMEEIEREVYGLQKV